MPHPRVALAVVTLLAASVYGAGAQMILQGPAPAPAPSQGPTFGTSPGPVMGGPGPVMGSPGPAVGPAPMMGGPMMGPGAQQSAPPCLANFTPLRSEAEKRAEVLKAAIEKKAERTKLCGLFRSFSDAEEKVVKYAVTNQKQCNIPADAVAMMKKNHAKTAQVREKVCAPEAAAKPAGPNLGEALGTTSLPTPDQTRTGGGTFDTLTGNPLSR